MLFCQFYVRGVVCGLVGPEFHQKSGWKIF